MSRPAVLCIHSFAGSARQYRGLAQRLAPRCDVLAADLYGHGDAPAWREERPFMLADEAAPFERLLPDAQPVHLVGHSYGAAVALRIAAAHRQRVQSMVLYEPAIWGTLATLCAGEPAALEIEQVRDETMALLARGALEEAAARFIDYWAGPGAWAATPPERRPRLLAAMRSLRDGWRASFAERWSAADLRSLNIPCLLLTGSRSTAAARRALQLLLGLLPCADVVEFENLGHLGPITHPERIDNAVEAFISRRSQSWAQPPHSCTA